MQKRKEADFPCVSQLLPTEVQRLVALNVASLKTIFFKNHLDFNSCVLSFTHTLGMAAFKRKDPASWESKYFQSKSVSSALGEGTDGVWFFYKKLWLIEQFQEDLCGLRLPLPCPFPSVSHLLNHLHTFPHFPSDQGHHWKTWFPALLEKCTAYICRLYMFIRKSVACLEEAIKQRSIWCNGWGYLWTYKLTDSLYCPFTWRITNMAFLSNSGTWTIQVKSDRGPRWHVAPIVL